MKKIIGTILLLISFSFIYGQEIQVALDLDGRIMNIDGSRERKLGLFPEYRGLQDARLWQINDNEYILEILYQPERTQMRVRLPYNAEEVQALRERVSNALRQTAPNLLINQEGRTLFLANSTLVGLTYYGAAVPVALDVDDFRGSLALYMLSAGGGFFLPRLITRNIPMPYGSSIMGMYGQTRGILYGAMLPYIFDEEASYKTTLFFGLLGSVGGVVGGYRWAENQQMTAGEAGLKSAMCDFGTLFGLTTADMLGLLDDAGPRAIASSILLGSAIGIGTSGMISKNTNYTYGDALVMRTSGSLGAYTGLSMAILFGAEESAAYSGLATAGGIGGIILGNYLAKENNFTSGEGFQTILGTSAGLFLGLGIGYLVSSDDFGDSKTIALMSSLGGIGGFALMTNLFAKRSDKRESSVSMNFNINPMALHPKLMNKQIQPGYNPMRMPLIQASMRF